ncbi:MAG: hypothetical protein ACI8ZH_000221 [Flavobacteriales bacterium]|jgi:hypothetical protein
MKKILLIAIVALLSFNNAQAQLPDGSIAPNFDLTDLNGTSHELYSYLDNGYTVFLDFSAVWCGPCWGYHIGGTLEDLFENHGPAGMSGVSPSTTDDVMVFMIEGDGNSLDCLNGLNCSNTYGDWVNGVNDTDSASGVTLYPIICTDGTANSTAVTSDYSIGYWPTIYMVCPDRLTNEVGQSSNPYGAISACPPPASNDNDARTFDYAGETLTCEGDLVPEIMIQNYGISNLTNLSIEVKVNGNSQSITPWTGNLATYATDNVILPALTGLANNDAVTIDVSQPNNYADADPTNNPTISFNIQTATQNTHTDATVTIETDAYGSETTWDIKDANGIVVMSGGPYNDLSAAGTTPQTPVTGTLNINECHTFTIYDSYGDGIDAGYGAGSFTVTDGNGTILASGGQFTDVDGAAFKTGSATATLNELISNLSIYPNPVKNVLTIEGNYTSVDIIDVSGKLVLSSEYVKAINVKSLSDGVYMLNIKTENGIAVKKITVAK